MRKIKPIRSSIFNIFFYKKKNYVEKYETTNNVICCHIKSKSKQIKVTVNRTNAI